MSPARRALLASLGTAAVAGCLGRPDDRAGDPKSSPTDESGSGPAADPEPPDSVDSEWPMPAADAGRSNCVPAAAGPTEPVAELWRVDAEPGLSSPVVAGGTVYVGGADGTVLALDARTGAERWRRSVGGPAATPWAVGEDLYVPTAEAVVALSAADGEQRWRTDVPVEGGGSGRAGTTSAGPSDGAVLGADHGVYRLSGGVGRSSAVVTALDRADGGERWRADLGDPVERHLFAGGGFVFVSTGPYSPIPWTLDPATGAVVGDEPPSGHDFPAERFYRDGTRYGLDPFFEIVEARAVAESGHGWSRGLPVKEDAAVSGGCDRVYHAGSGGDGPALHALSATDGAVAWTGDAVTDPVGRPVVAGECVLVPTAETLHCFDPADGTERWSRPADGAGRRVAVADDLLYATGGGAVRALRPRRS